MNKRQGLTLGAILAAGLLLRPAGSPAPQQGQSSTGGTSLLSSSASMAAQGQGPWIASCNYWAPMRPPASSKNSAEVHGTLDAEDSGIDLHVRLNQTNQDRELGCQNDPVKRWGFPAHPIDVTAIIATVPDPVHAHTAMNFDRSVDALLQAAADNGYVCSHYWLPWKNRVGAAKAAESEGNAEPGHDAVRERQPGLIILRAVGASLQDSYDRVIYVFLAAETSTLGIDGFQLENAFAYEDELEQVLSGSGNHISRGRKGHVAIVGPGYTGSAASLRAAIDTAQLRYSTFRGAEFEVTGATSTRLPADELTSKQNPKIDYLSFQENGEYGTDVFRERLKAAHYDPRRFTLLIEDDTTLGKLTFDKSTDYEVIHFPRDISLLRNAQGEDYNNQAAVIGSVPSPYLRFSLKDPSPQDSVPDFSAEHTPLSQEAQLMAIARQIHRDRSQFVGIVASNVLDQIFLAQFLHRACPDVMLVFFGSDLLMVREIDNVPFIGSITITPYSLIGLGRGFGRYGRAYPSSSNQAYYNAVAYTLWDKTDWNPSGGHPSLQGYRNLLEPQKDPPDVLQPSLWATAIGSDGYYPLAALSPCVTDDPRILPAITRSGARPEACMSGAKALPQSLGRSTIYPARLWIVLCALVSVLCLLHIVMLVAADFWSPLTRDLAIGGNDQSRRRSMFMHVAAAMLFSMAFAVSFPVLALNRIADVSRASVLAGLLTLGFGVVAVVATFWKTWAYVGWSKATPKPFEGSADPGGVDDRVCLFVTFVAWIALVAMPLIWARLCLAGSEVGSPVRTIHFAGASLVYRCIDWVRLCLTGALGSVYFVGASFAYRCLNPSSGVSPVLAVLVLLFGWYLWAFFQTRRLRFSEYGRPRLPKGLKVEGDSRLFVSDDDLSDDDPGGCDSPPCCYLYDNISCLLITRQLLRRFWASHKGRSERPAAGQTQSGGAGRRGRHGYLAIDIVLVVLSAGLLVCFSFFTPIRSLDHFVWNARQYRSSPYELLVGVLFGPLILVCLAGWLRMILVWAALKRGLLERLENLPIRFSFSRLKVMGWLTMLSQAGLREQWRDMARSVESISQMLHQPDLKGLLSESKWLKPATPNTNLAKKISQLRLRIAEPAARAQAGERDCDFVRNLELDLAAFSQELLEAVLIPYWKHGRTGPVESEEVEELPIKARRSPMEAQHPHVPMELRAGPSSSEPPRILVAEEFLAIRYMSLIRSVLANMRYLMVFVSASFVLAMMAWNSYPFRPRQQVDWLFTVLLVLFGSGMIWVFAQMHRDSILSRITDTKANELGWDFYVRVISFGALPVFAWLAYQFPDIGSAIYRFVEPVVPVVK